MVWEYGNSSRFLNTVIFVDQSIHNQFSERIFRIIEYVYTETRFAFVFKFRWNVSFIEYADGFIEARRILRERYPVELSLEEINAEIAAARSSKTQ